MVRLILKGVGVSLMSVVRSTFYVAYFTHVNEVMAVDVAIVYHS